MCRTAANAVVGVLNHILRTLRKEHPEINKAYLRSDNGGCYHMIDFSDPQGGKGPCDRKAATIKAHVLPTLMKEITSSPLQI